MSLASLIPKNAPVTFGLVVVCGLVYFAQGASLQALTEWGGLFGPRVARGEWWRVLSSAFIHGGVLHLLVNMGLLYALGQQLEQIVGGLRFGLIYAGSIATASVAVMLFAPTQFTLGASGAVMGIAVAFAVFLLLYARDNRHQSLLMLVAMNLALPLMIPGISFWGHFGGAVGGLIMVAVLVIWPLQVRNHQIKTGSVYTAERHPMAKESLITGAILVVALFVGSVLASHSG